MKNTKIRRILTRVALLMLVVLMLIPTISASAVSEKTDELGYDTYTYWYEFNGMSNRVVQSKPMYQVDKVITALEIGCTTPSAIEDSHVSEVTGYTYVLDGGSSRILVFDENYNQIKTISYVLNNDGSKMYFNKAKGIFVDKAENLYIADTENARVLKCDADGKLIRDYVLPKSELIPAGFNYQPIKVAIDSKGYVYILSNGSYYGAILYSPEDEFLGFYGANNVAATVMQAMQTLYRRLFMTEEALKNGETILPFTFNDLWVDNEDFIYTVTGSSVGSGQVKRLNPGGSNILGSDGVNFVDNEKGTDPVNKTKRTQNLVGIAADDQGFAYVIDSYYGRIYIYDSECNLISTFGGGIKSGLQEGTFYNPSSISYNKKTQSIIITDNSQNTITVFKITDYGKMVKSAQAKTVVGDYEEAMEEWSNVLGADRNCQLAYAGLAKAYYFKGQTTEDAKLAKTYNDNALELSKQGYDRETYAMAFNSTRTEIIRDNFTWIMVLIVVLVAGVIALLVYSTKHKVRIIKNEKLHLAATMLTHPFENFHDIKEKKLTSIPICLGIIVLYYIFDVMESTLGGFAFTYFDPSSYNALLVLAKTAGLVILWTVANWAVCTLLSGKGKMVEIFTVISYALIPSLLGSIVYVVCTNILVPEEAAFLSVLLTICSIYTIILLAAGSIIVHDFGLGKFIVTTLLTLLGCAIVVFLLIAVAILLQQTGGFIATLYSEILKLF